MCHRTGGPLRSRAAALSLVPSTWSHSPAGWYLSPSSTVPLSHELHVTKRFVFLDHGAQYRFLGEAMALAQELHCLPRLDWFYAELSFTLPPTAEAAVLATFLNDWERAHCGLRNQSNYTSTSSLLWCPALRERLTQRACGDFCWLLTQDTEKTRRFLQEIYVQWHHRADYLVSRGSRERREFRQDMTLLQVMQNGQQRRRRLQRRRGVVSPSPSSAGTRNAKDATEVMENVTHDVLPREVREMLDRESDGMEDVRMSRLGTATGGWGRSGRSSLNYR